MINGHVTIVIENRNLKPQPFVSSNDQISMGRAWEEWLEGIECEIKIF